MASTNPRIIVVDARNKLHHLVRAALELMGRRPRLIETYTSDDALEELKISSPDLLITAQSLSDNTNGPVLAILAKRELAALPIMVIGEEDDQPLDADTLAQSPFQYLHRPFAPESFIRELRVALDGPEAAPRDTVVEDLVPVPAINAEPLKPIMFRLMRDVGAMTIILADRNGKVIAYEGAAGYFDRDLLAAALGPAFGALIRLTSTIGEQPRVLKHFEGERANIFGLALGLHYFVMLVFNGKIPAGALGNVKRFGGSAINDMLVTMGDEAFNPHPVIQAAPSKYSPNKRKTKTQDMLPVRTPAPAALPSVAAPASRPASKPASRAEAPAPAKPSAPGGFDASLLDGLDKIDTAQADALFNLETMLKNGTSMPGNRISFDDAIEQGIIDNIDEE